MDGHMKIRETPEVLEISPPRCGTLNELDEFEALKSSRCPAQNRLGTRPKIRPGGDAGDGAGAFGIASPNLNKFELFNTKEFTQFQQLSEIKYQFRSSIRKMVGKLQNFEWFTPKERIFGRAHHGRTQQTTRSKDLSGSCWVTNNQQGI